MNEIELNDFIEISKFAGERFDLVQAGGGNSSVKNDNGTMFIKASGTCLSEVDENYGYAIVKNIELLDIFNEKDLLNATNKREREQIVNKFINKVNLTKNFRPSIETLLHSMLKKYTLHTHPVIVNSITCLTNWKEILNKIFNNTNIICVDYYTPGFDLALELKKLTKNNPSNIIFLQNHGLIITSNEKNEIFELTEFVVSKIEQYLKVDLSNYKIATSVSKLLPRNLISYVSSDKFILDNLNTKYLNSLPFCPDKMVYCGIKPLILEELSCIQIKNYKDKYFEYPKVIFYKNNLIFVAKNIRKAKEIEEVFKFHLMALKYINSDNINYLSIEEIKYIGNWEAEKYRQNI